MQINGLGLRRIFYAAEAGSAPASTTVTEATVIAEAAKGKESMKAWLAQYGLTLADNSAQEDMVMGYLKDKYSGYPALVVNIIRALGGKKLMEGPGDGQPSVMNINGSVTAALGKSCLTPGQTVADATIRQAVLDRWNERNSCCAKATFDEILIAR